MNFRSLREQRKTRSLIFFFFGTKKHICQHLLKTSANKSDLKSSIRRRTVRVSTLRRGLLSFIAFSHSSRLIFCNMKHERKASRLERTHLECAICDPQSLCILLACTLPGCHCLGQSVKVSADLSADLTWTDCILSLLACQFLHVFFLCWVT